MGVLETDRPGLQHTPVIMEDACRLPEGSVQAMLNRQNANDLAAGGIAAMDGIHAVFEMAVAPSHQQAMLAGRFRSLMQGINAGGSEAGRRGFALALARLLYVAVQALAMPPNPKVARLSPATVADALRSMMKDEPSEVHEVARMAADSRLAADFIRVVGDPPPRPNILAAAASVVLRDVLRTRGGQDDPLQRWTLFGQVSNAVIAAHYLNPSQVRSTAG